MAFQELSASVRGGIRYNDAARRVFTTCSCSFAAGMVAILNDWRRRLHLSVCCTAMLGFWCDHHEENWRNPGAVLSVGYVLVPGICLSGRICGENELVRIVPMQGCTEAGTVPHCTTFGKSAHWKMNRTAPVEVAV